MDYCFLGRVLDKTKAQEETMVSDLMTPEGPEAEAEGVMPVLVTEALKFCGRQRVILHTDAEPSTKAL